MVCIKKANTAALPAFREACVCSDPALADLEVACSPACGATEKAPGLQVGQSSKLGQNLLSSLVMGNAVRPLFYQPGVCAPSSLLKEPHLSTYRPVILLLSNPISCTSVRVQPDFHFCLLPIFYRTPSLIVFGIDSPTKWVEIHFCCI